MCCIIFLLVSIDLPIEPGYDSAMDISTIMPALADPTRRAIFEAVLAHPRSVSELSMEFPVSRPAVSQHLKHLNSAGLLRFDSIGTRNIYRVDPAALAAMRNYIDRLDQVWACALDQFRTVAEASYLEQQKGK